MNHQMPPPNTYLCLSRLHKLEIRNRYLDNWNRSHHKFDTNKLGAQAYSLPGRGSGPHHGQHHPRYAGAGKGHHEAGLWNCQTEDGPRLRYSSKSPILPAVPVFHVRKSYLHHQLARSIITELIPEIGTSNCIATSDYEFTPLLENLFGQGWLLLWEKLSVEWLGMEERSRWGKFQVRIFK